MWGRYTYLHRVVYNSSRAGFIESEVLDYYRALCVSTGPLIDGVIPIYTFHCWWSLSTFNGICLTQIKYWRFNSWYIIFTWVQGHHVRALYVSTETSIEQYQGRFHWVWGWALLQGVMRIYTSLKRGRYTYLHHCRLHGHRVFYIIWWTY